MTSVVPSSAAQSSYANPKNVILFYDDYPTRGDPNFQITREIATPLVAHLDKTGMPTGWMFDSFIFFSIYLYSDRKPTHAYIDAWISFLFDGNQISNLDSTVAECKASLNEPDYQVNVLLAVPAELKSDNYHLNETYTVDENDILNNLNTLLNRWNALNPRNLRLTGFYWGFTENPTEVVGYGTTIPKIADFIHSKGLKLMLIPFLKTYSFDFIHGLGFDLSTMQPNYAWFANPSLDMFAKVNSAISSHYADGAEFEIPVPPLESTTCCGGNWSINQQTYLDQAYSFGWNRNTVNSYYHGSTISFMGRASDPRIRQGYDKIYQFIKSTKATLSVIRSASLNAIITGSDIPSSMVAGKAYSVHVAIRNTGTTTWTATSKLIRVGLNSPFQPADVGLDSAVSVSPGQEYTLT